MITLQTVVFPEQGFCTEPDLYLRLDGDAWLREAAGEISLEAGASARFDTAFNLLSIGKWHGLCQLDGLFLGLRGTGAVEVRAFLAVPGLSWERLCCDVLTLDPDTEAVIDLSSYALSDTRGVIWFELRAIGPRRGASLTAARYMTRASVARPMALALWLAPDAPVDPDDATGTVARAPWMRARLATWAAAEGARLLDGADAGTALAAAKADGATHAIIVSPQAALSVEVLNRAHVFLQLARTPQMALTASVFHSAERWRVEQIAAEAGAALAGTGSRNEAGKLFPGVSLRDRLNVIAIEHDTLDLPAGAIAAQPDFLALSLATLRAVPETGRGTKTPAGLLPADLHIITLNGIIVVPAPVVAAARPETVLQTVIFPEQGVCTEPDLFFHLLGPAGFHSATRTVSLDPGATVFFDTYFNALSIGKWHAASRLDGLFLGLQGIGQVEVKVFHAIPDRSWELLLSEVVTLSKTRDVLLDLSDYPLNATTGVIYFELRPDGGRAVTLTGARYLTHSTPKAALRPALCLPPRPRGVSSDAAQADQRADAARLRETMRRDSFTRARLQAWAEEAGCAVFETGPVDAALAQAAAQGYSHALVIDPQAALPVEALNRALTYLGLAEDPRAAITAATFHETDRWRAGLIAAEALPASAQSAGRKPREGAGLPLFTDADLRDRRMVLAIENDTLNLAPGTLLAQRDFLAFPLAAPADAAPAPLRTAPSVAEPALPAEAAPETAAAQEPAYALAINDATAPVPAAEPVADIPAAGVIDTRRAAAALFTAPEGLRIATLNGVIVVPAPVTEITGQMTTLQHVIFPEQGICTETDLFFHLDGPAGFQGAAGTISLDHGAMAFFDTYFNALSIGKWHASCQLDGLFLGLRGIGRVEIKVFHAIPDQSWELLVSEVVGLSKTRDTLLDLSHYALNATNGVIYFEARAVDPQRGAVLSGARYMTRTPPDPAVKLAISITTFKREEQVETTAARLDQFLDQSEFADNIHVFIVDNGNSATIPPSPHITRFPNANLGGAGGFSRGLVEAQARGFSHVLFMDDDASILMENIHRAYAFFTLATDKKVAIAGAMINNTDKWRMWENGAIFDRKCMPLFSGTDLRTRSGVMHLEFESGRMRPDKMYGGWWFFAFPVAQVTRHPFPFFVRGDDVNFSLVNDFHITTLNGLVSFQDDFTDKESPLTWYLDLRSHMVHHLTLEKMEVGAIRLARIPVWFFMRNLVKFQYETIEAVLLAFNHVMQGPDYFVKNADAAGPRAAIKALTRQEAWKPLGQVETTETRRFWAGHGWRYRLYRMTLNGHLLPFHKLFANRIVLPPMDRGNYAPMWGASRITFLNSTRDKAYMTQHSKRRFVVLAARLILMWLRFVLTYGSLRAAYRRRYPEITTRTFWETTLEVPVPAAAAPAEDAVVLDSADPPPVADQPLLAKTLH